MGYTRYWTRPRKLDPSCFAKFAAECETACAVFGMGLKNTMFSDDAVSFEGNPGCEPFAITVESTGRERSGRVSEFCKTQKLPYDRAVEACLILLKQHFPEVEVPEPS